MSSRWCGATNQSELSIGILIWSNCCTRTVASPQNPSTTRRPTLNYPFPICNVTSPINGGNIKHANTDMRCHWIASAFIWENMLAPVDFRETERDLKSGFGATEKRRFWAVTWGQSHCDCYPCPMFRFQHVNLIGLLHVFQLKSTRHDIYLSSRKA